MSSEEPGAQESAPESQVPAAADIPVGAPPADTVAPEAAPTITEPATPPDPALRPLTKYQRRFVNEYLIDLNGAAAIRRCKRYKGKQHSQKANRMLKKPHIAAAVRKALALEENLSADQRERIRRALQAQAYTNPNELVELRRDACRYCHGIGHRYQRTPAEHEHALGQHEAQRLRAPKDAPFPEFDEQGGIGFNPNKPPHPECPECHGEGIERLFMRDTRTLSSEAQALYAGAKLTERGIELKFNSQDRARELLARIHGLLVDKHEHTGKDGAPLQQQTVVVLSSDEVAKIDRKLDDEV